MNCIDQIIKESPYLSSFIAILIIAVIYASENLKTEYSAHIEGHNFLKILTIVFGYGLPLFSLNFLLLFIWTSKTYFIFISLILVSLTFSALTSIFIFLLFISIQLKLYNRKLTKFIKRATKDINDSDDPSNTENNNVNST